MAFQFPPSPTVNQTLTPVVGVTYRWSGTAWHLIAGPGAFLTAADADTRYVNIDEAQNTTNRIINGKMAIDQRNAGAAVVANSGAVQVYGADRWHAFAGGTVVGAVSLQRLINVFAGLDMLRATVATIDAALTDTFYLFGTRIEGYNTADLFFGQAGAKSFTLTFQVLSSITATLPIAFRNVDNTRTYVTTFNVVASTPAVISVTVPGDTAGTWNTTNNIGLRAEIVLGARASLQVPSANSWQNGNSVTVAGCTNLMATVGANIAIGDVRLYKGSVDFGPDRRLYAEELALCQRYYQKSYDIGTVPGALTSPGELTVVQVTGASLGLYTHDVRRVVPMRALPTMVFYNPNAANAQMRNVSIASDFTVTAVAVNSESSFTVQATAPAGSSSGQLCAVHWTASAEL